MKILAGSGASCIVACVWPKPTRYGDNVEELWRLFLAFLKINILSPSGPASLGIIHEETVGKFITDEQFVEAAAFSRFLPGSDALQLAVYVGYGAAGVPGAIVACTAAILPPTIIMIGVAALLQKLRGEAWVDAFVSGITPALAVLLVFIAYELAFESRVPMWREVAIAGLSLIALLLRVSPALVLVGAGCLGIVLYR